MNTHPPSSSEGSTQSARAAVRGQRLRPAGVGAAVALVLLSAAGAGTAAAAPPTTAAECATTASGAVTVTPDCVDPLYRTAVIDSTSEETSPVVHRTVKGHFAESPTIKFEIHLPPADQFEGRFYQYTYPLTDEKATADAIAFGAASGAYTVQAGGPPPVLGYRHAAAAAKFAETVAADYYKTQEPIRGYLYGPSGGSFQTVGAAENTSGVWDGFAPLVLGVPMSAPYTFFIRAMADLVLADDAGGIADAVQPGGSGDAYAGLDAAERTMLKELTSFGVPLRAWEDPEYLLGRSSFTPDGLLGFGAVVRQVDPTYADDFWSKPGYLGTEQSALGDLVRAARVQGTATVSAVRGSPVTAVTLTGLPTTTSPRDLDFTVLAADGTTAVGPVNGTLDPSSGELSIAAGNSEDVLAALTSGAEVAVDNRWSLALRSYYRHQVPPASEGYAGFDQFRGSGGQPLYPQRALLIGPLVQGGATGGATYNGKINGKMIVVDNLVDADALPHHADWYAQRVRSALGAKSFGDSFRVYYNDAADHQEAPVTGTRATHLIDWYGSAEQALRDLSAWVEEGVAPPASTRYSVKDGQVVVPAEAAARRGIQPVVDLSVQGRDQITITAGQEVSFKGRASVPPGAGKIIETAWDFEGTGAYTATKVGDPQRTVVIDQRYRFTRPGTYDVSLRVAANRAGDVESAFADVQNLGRVRVVVQAGRS